MKVSGWWMGGGGWQTNSSRPEPAGNGQHTLHPKPLLGPWGAQQPAWQAAHPPTRQVGVDCTGQCRHSALPCEHPMVLGTSPHTCAGAELGLSSRRPRGAVVCEHSGLEGSVQVSEHKVRRVLPQRKLQVGHFGVPQRAGPHILPAASAGRAGGWGGSKRRARAASGGGGCKNMKQRHSSGAYKGGGGEGGGRGGEGGGGLGEGGGGRGEGGNGVGLGGLQASRGLL